MENSEIKNLLCVKYPWLLVDSVEEIMPAKRIKGRKLVSGNDSFFQNNEWNYGFVPEFFQIEVFSQLLVIAMAAAIGQGRKETREFEWSIDILRQLRIGECFDAEVEILSWRRGIARAQLCGYVGNEKVSSGTMKLAVLDVFNQYRVKNSQT
jgi:3-hydroxyacyl-[acyl-carrier-protein] dehydratase